MNPLQLTNSFVIDKDKVIKVESLMDYSDIHFVTRSRMRIWMVGLQRPITIEASHPSDKEAYKSLHKLFFSAESKAVFSESVSIE